MTDLQEIVRDAAANCAWMDATNPNYSKAVSAHIGTPRKLKTYETVLAIFGEDAAVAWQAAADARGDFFAAISKQATE